MDALRMSGLVAALFVALLVAVPAASAQGAAASVTLTVPPGPTVVPQGGNVSLSIGVALSLEGLICAPGPSTANVRLSISDPSPLQGITYTLPPTVTFDLLAPMAYSSAGPYDGQQSVPLNVTVASGTLPNHDHPLNITAAISATDISGCQAAPVGTLDASDSKGTLLQTGAGPGGSTTTGPGMNGTDTTAAETSVSLPLGIQIPVLLGLGMLVLRRRTA